MEKIKKNCNGCRALEQGVDALGYMSSCALGYGMSRNNELFEYRPTQQCPKPRTIGQLVKLLNQ